MSEAALEPTERLPERAINVRKALAGMHLLAGKTYAESLQAAGFAPSTSRNPSSNGLNADRCLEELKKLDPEATPAKILGLVRTRALQALESSHGSQLKLGDVARLLDVTERAFGAGQPLDALDEGRDLPDRDTFLSMLAHMRDARIGPRVATREALSPPIDAIEVTETAEQRGESAEPQGANVPMSDNGQYDSCDTEGESVKAREP